MILFGTYFIGWENTWKYFNLYCCTLSTYVLILIKLMGILGNMIEIDIYDYFTVMKNMMEFLIGLDTYYVKKQYGD